MEVEESFPTLGGIYFLPGTQINSWLKCGTQSIVNKKTGSMVFANDDGIIVLEKDCNYCPNDLKSRVNYRIHFFIITIIINVIILLLLLLLLLLYYIIIIFIYISEIFH